MDKILCLCQKAVVENNARSLVNRSDQGSRCLRPLGLY